MRVLVIFDVLLELLVFYCQHRLFCRDLGQLFGKPNYCQILACDGSVLACDGSVLPAYSAMVRASSSCNILVSESGMNTGVV